MVEPSSEFSRLLTTEQTGNLYQDVLATVIREGKLSLPMVEKEEDLTVEEKGKLTSVKLFIRSGIDMIEKFEEASYQKHPEIHTDTDVVDVDSGPGPYSYDMLEPGKTDLDDVNYHQYPWSRKMDRARIRAAYALTAMITAKRIEEQTGVKKPSRNLTAEDFASYGPYMMYTSVGWQVSHIKHVLRLLREAGTFKVPDSKLIMYEEFVNREGERKPIVHTEDQIEGLNFPSNPDGTPPRRVAIVSHPAHLMRIMYILGKYQDSIPAGTKLQPFPIPTPKAAIEEYAKAELIVTLMTIFVKNRASLNPYRVEW